MSDHLLLLDIGPIQGFIAAARRTRDLWFGSYVLSEVSKAAARRLKEGGAELIFPNPRNDDDLAPKSDFNVGNRVLVRTAGEPRQLLDSAKEAARGRWREFADETLAHVERRCRGRNVLRDEVWRSQVDDILEFFASWVSLEGKGYPEARQELERLAAARKATRDFVPLANDPDSDGFVGLPKSSLDGARETVLQELDEPTRRHLRLGKGEQLDCTGLVKRLAKPERFTATTRIALDPWVRRVEALGQEKLLGPVNEVLDRIARVEEWDLATSARGNRGIYSALPYDGSLLYDFRLRTAERDAKKEDDAGRMERLRELGDALKPLSKVPELGTPCPYLAVLLADGDHMGRLLDGVKDAEPHREISKALADFSARVPETVRSHRGHCVYAGGDDVLALVPVDTVLECGRALYQLFSDTLAPVAESLGVETPTLSVGVGIGHMQEHLGRLRGLAHRAERLAKGDDLPLGLPRRNALAIIVRPRSGAELEWRDRWDNRPDDRLARWAQLHRDEVLPDKAAYELRTAARTLAGLPEPQRRELQGAEAVRILSRKQGERGRTHIPADTRAELERLASEDLERLAGELVLARWLAAHVTD